MNIMKKIWAVGLLAGLGFTALGAQPKTSASAQPLKIGIVDMSKVIDNYYKTRAVNESLKEKGADLEKKQGKLMADLKKAGDEYNKARDDSYNQAISAEEREKAKRTAEAKFKAAQEARDTLDAFNARANAEMREQRGQLLEKILEEIRIAVSSQAKAGAYTLVLDSASESIRGTQLVLFNNGENDLTAAVLSQLNTLAPKGDEKKTAKP